MTIQWITPAGGSSEPIYLYSNPSEHPVSLNGIYITQHGRKIRTISAPVRDLDRICKTPEIGERDNRAMHNLYTQTNIPWQRRLNMRRVPDISRWWNNTNSTSANGALIYLEDNTDFSDAEGSCSVTLDPSAWTFTMCPGEGGQCGWTPSQENAGWTGWHADVCPKCGHTEKPGVVVDGQHRLRGMSSEPKGQEMELVFASVVCRSDGFTRSMVSKIFTEVTSSAESLAPLHQEFLSAKYDLAPKYDDSTPEGQMMKRAYGIAAKLNNSGTRWGNATSTAQGRVQMIERRPTTPSDVIDVQRLAEYIFSWMTTDTEISGGSVVPLDGMTDKQIYTAMEQFLEAALLVWPGDHYWRPQRRPTAPLQTRGVFRMLMHCFKLITARLSMAGSELDLANYNKEISHIQAISWTQAEWPNVYTRQDADQNRTRSILTHIYDIAPNPLGSTPQIPAQINAWMSQSPEAVVLVDAQADSGDDKLSIEFESSFSCSGVAPSTVDWPLKAKRTAFMTVKNLNTNEDAAIEVKSNSFSVRFSDLDDMAPNPGNRLEVQIHFTSWSSSPTILEFEVDVV